MSKWMLLSLITMALADSQHCSHLGFCMDIPDRMISINEANYQSHLDLLPKSLESSFRDGVRQEILLDGEESNSSFILMRLSKAGGNEIDVEKTCKSLKIIDREYLKYCGKIPWPVLSKQGVMSLTYNGIGKKSVIKIWIKLDGITLYVISIDSWLREEDQKAAATEILEILYTLRRYDE